LYQITATYLTIPYLFNIHY